MSWTFIYLMVALKIPIAALLWLVWWAVHQEPETSDEKGDGGTRRPRHPRPSRPRRPRLRGPPGAPVPAPPARVRTLVARGRTSTPHR